MILSRITLRNWLSFRGTHALELGPTIYGVTARLETDESRSNWLGKSSLLGAARFALYGSFSHLGGCEREGDWITRGEDEGGVRVELDDGTVVDRRRGRGTATELAARIAGVASKGERAAELLLRHVGLSEDDFCTVSYLEQKKLARVVTDMRPSDRQEVVSSWLMLGPLRLAEERERKSLAAIRAREERLVASAETLARVRAGAAALPTEERVEEARVALYEARERVKRFQKESATATDRRATRKARAAVDEGIASVEEEIGRLSSEETPRADVAGDRERESEARAASRRAQDEATRRRSLVAGRFDGRCPVAPIDCPAREQIDGMREEKERAAAAAEREARGASSTWQLARAILTEAEKVEKTNAACEQRLVALRRQLASMKEIAGRAPEGEEEPIDETVGARLSEAESERDAANARVDELVREREAALRLLKQEAEVAGELARVRAEAAASREAIAILGRNGAQRRLAREALASIEARANERLASAGIDLRMTFDWGRPTAKPAEECHACGLPFPASARVKECACGAERGKKVEEGLWVRLSNRSGAAEDLAGFALGVAAGEWLREERGAPWAVLFADEPFGALDAAHRRALASSVARLLTPGGYRQALVVAHHPGLMDGLPGRIRIASDGASSRIDTVGA